MPYMLAQIGGCVRRFKNVEEVRGDRPCSGRPATVETTEAKDMVDALIVDHHRFTCELRAAQGLGKPAVMAVIRKHGYRNVCARCMLKMSTFEH
jgi:hypothetical protein